MPLLGIRDFPFQKVFAISFIFSFSGDPNLSHPKGVLPTFNTCPGSREVSFQNEIGTREGEDVKVSLEVHIYSPRNSIFPFHVGNMFLGI